MTWVFLFKYITLNIFEIIQIYVCHCRIMALRSLLELNFSLTKVVASFAKLVYYKYTIHIQFCIVNSVQVYSNNRDIPMWYIE